VNASVLVLYLQSYALAGSPPVVRTAVWGFPPQPVSALAPANKLNVIQATFRSEPTADSGTWYTGRARACSVSDSSSRQGNLSPLSIQSGRGTWLVDSAITCRQAGSERRRRWEVHRDRTPFCDRAPGTKRHYWRIDPDMSDEEFDGWADRFVDTVLGEVVEQKGGTG